MKTFKKLAAVVLAAVMALAMLTACGSAADTADVLTALNKKLPANAQVVEDDKLEKDANIVLNIVVDNINKTGNKVKIDAAIANLKLKDGEKAFYVLTDNADEAAAEIAAVLTKDSSVTYTRICIKSGSQVAGDSYVCGVASTGSVSDAKE